MTVAQLIEALQKFPPELEVRMEVDDGGWEKVRSADKEKSYTFQDEFEYIVVLSFSEK